MSLSYRICCFPPPFESSFSRYFIVFFSIDILLAKNIVGSQITATSKILFFFSAMSRFRSFEFNKYNNNKRKLKLNREYEKLSLKHWFQVYVWLYHRYMWRQSYQHCISTVNDRTANRWERKPNKTEKKPEKKSVLKISWKDQLIIHTKPNTLFLIIFLTFIFFVFFSLNLYVMS